MLDAGETEVRLAGPELGGGDGAVGAADRKRTGRERDDDIGVFVAVPARGGAGGEAPFDDAHALVVDLDGRNRAAGFGHGQAS
ncbi:MAG: hypothetical protein HYU41_14980 [Candidatus Rokubacteria bacterium]|nr:hypothetical protein [Candidatus Rokubacteria bacterium]